MTLKTRATMGFFLILAATAFGQAPCAFAQAEKLQAEVFMIGVQKPIVMQEFAINNEQFYDSFREGKEVKLFFRDLKEIRFLNPGLNNEVEVVFNDGRKEKHELRPASDITVISDTSIVSLHHSKVSRIAFSPIPAQQSQAAAPPVAKPPQAGIQSGPGTFDRVILKNGDTLSGHVQNAAFSVRAPYGTFQFETGRIASIEFDEKGSNTGVVLLRSGDRLSGTLEAEPVLFMMPSGQGISFEAKTIKAINFKR